MSLRVFVVAGFDATFRAEFLKIRCYGSVPSSLGIPAIEARSSGRKQWGRLHTNSTSKCHGCCLAT